MSGVSRRGFLQASAACAGGLALPVLAPRLFVGTAGASGVPTLVVINLRGGLDGLSVAAPHEANYFDRRRSLAVPAEQALPLDGTFGMHPALGALYELWQDGRVAIVPAVGSGTHSRSHFQEMLVVEKGLGTPDARNATGWLTRHLATRPGGATGLTLATTTSPPDALAQWPGSVSVDPASPFEVSGFDGDTGRVHAAIAALHGGPSLLEERARTTVQLTSSFAGLAAAAPGYPDNEVGRQLGQIGQLLHRGVGVEVACVDVGGYDTHKAQAPRLPALLDALGSGLNAFAADLGGLLDAVTVLVVSEFGRRLQENGSGGTDHGWGGVAMVVGGGVAPGMHGPWAGLGDDVLVGGDVPVLTDLRSVMAEVLDRRLGNGQVGDVFPGWSGAYPGVIA